MAIITIPTHDPLANLLVGRVSFGARGRGIPKSHHCVDCGFDTAPGAATRAECLAARAAGKAVITCKLRLHEMYIVHREVWAYAGMTPNGGCLCVECIEERIGRRLNAADFKHPHALHQGAMKRAMTKRLRSRMTV